MKNIKGDGNKEVKKNDSKGDKWVKVRNKPAKAYVGKFSEVKDEGLRERRLPITPKRAIMINQTLNALIEHRGVRDHAAEALGISVQALFKRFRTYPSIIKRYEAFNQQSVQLAKEMLKQSALEAAQEVINLSKGARSERTRLDANLEILDRAGIPKENSLTSANVQVNVLNAIKEDSSKFDLE